MKTFLILDFSDFNDSSKKQHGVTSSIGLERTLPAALVQASEFRILLLFQ